MKHNTIETIVGFIVIFTAIYFFVFAYRISNSAKDNDGYVLNASFQNIEGLSEGDDVKLSGIKIGYVNDLFLEKDSYFANVRLTIKKEIVLPSDSRAIVASNGLLGGKYIKITPGAAEDNLKNNDRIKFTQGAINLEDLINKLVYSFTTGNKQTTGQPAKP